MDRGHGPSGARSLHREARAGAVWTGGAAIVCTLLQVGQLAVLAHWLQPEDFGLMALVLIVVNFAQMFSDLGTSNAVIHRQQASPSELSTLFWWTQAAGLCVFGIVSLLSPGLAALFGEPALRDVLWWSAGSFLIVPSGQLYQVILQKRLEFRRLAACDVAAALTGSTVAIGASLAGLGVWSLVWGHLSAAAVRSSALVLVGRRHWGPSCHFDRRELGAYVGFGCYQMGERLVGFLTQRVDQVFIGWFLGAQALGYYSLAYTLVTQPVLRINAVLARVALPVFAMFQTDTNRLARGYMRLRQLLASVNAPLLLGFSAVAGLFVPTVLGQRWGPAVDLVHLLALVALLRSMIQPVSSVLLARGRADLGFKWNLLVLLLLAPAVLTGGTAGGLPGVTLSLLLVQILLFGLEYPLLIRPVLGPVARQHYASVLPALLTAVIMALGVVGLPRLVDLRALPALTLQIVVGAALYLALNWFVFPRRTRAVLNLLGHRDG